MSPRSGVTGRRFRRPGQNAQSKVIKPTAGLVDEARTRVQPRSGWIFAERKYEGPRNINFNSTDPRPAA